VQVPIKELRIVMRKRNQTRAIRTSANTAEVRPISWSYLLLTIFCAALMAIGFFFAALQHFATIDLGFKNSKLRKQVDDLQSEKRRLLLAKEVSLSPVEITKAARKYGFTEAGLVPAVVSMSSLSEQVRSSAEVVEKKQAEAVPSELEIIEASGKKVVKTASVRPQAGSKTVVSPETSPRREPQLVDGRPRQVTESRTKVDSAGIISVAKLR